MYWIFRGRIRKARLDFNGFLWDTEGCAGGSFETKIRREVRMIVCEFCLQYRQNGECGLGLKIPKSMTCREFGPTIEKFCSDPKDFVDPKQIVQMATYFGIKGPELKKIKLMAAPAETSRLSIEPSPTSDFII